MEIPRLGANFETKKTNISSESIDFHQRYEVSGCVTKKLLRIPRRGL